MNAVLDHGTLVLMRDRVSQHDQVKVRVGVSADAKCLREPLRRCDVVPPVLQQKFARFEEFGVIRD